MSSACLRAIAVPSSEVTGARRPRRYAMTTICWTVIHHAAAPIVQAATKVAHVAHRRVGCILHRAAQAPHHTGSVAAHPHAWFELVCKVVPVAVAGGGL